MIHRISRFVINLSVNQSVYLNDVAVIVPTDGDRKFGISRALWHDNRQVSFLIEPVLMAEDRWSPLYDDVMRTGIPV